MKTNINNHSNIETMNITELQNITGGDLLPWDIRRFTISDELRKKIFG